MTAARAVGAVVVGRKGEPSRLNPHAPALLAAAPDPVSVIDALAADLYAAWTASEIEAHMAVFEQLAGDPRESVGDAVRRHLAAAKEHANAARERDRRRDADRSQSFE